MHCFLIFIIYGHTGPTICIIAKAFIALGVKAVVKIGHGDKHLQLRFLGLTANL